MWLDLDIPVQRRTGSEEAQLPQDMIGVVSFFGVQDNSCLVYEGSLVVWTSTGKPDQSALNAHSGTFKVPMTTP